MRTKKDYQTSAFLALEYYLINTTKPPFDDVRVRKALNMAIDKQAICDFRANGQIPATRMTPPNLPGYTGPEGDPYDPERARQLLAEAGYPGGRDKDGRQLRVEIVYNTLESIKQNAQLAQSHLRNNLGIEVELVNQEWKVYLSSISRLSYSSLARRSWIGDYVDPNTFLDLMLSASVNNGSGWKDPEYDRMLFEANAQTDPARRLELLAAAEKRVLDAQPLIPVYFGAANYLRKPYVTGVTPNLLDVHPVKFWGIER
jgi:oligopeptide transport system substrate-binding protein